MTGRSSAIRGTTRTASWRSFTPSSCGSTTRSPNTWAGRVSFENIRQQVRWHYQWMLVTDFLPTLINNETFTSVFPNPHKPADPRLPGLQNGLQLMPVKFSAAAFPFGHSMIPPEHPLNTPVERRPIFSRDSDDGAPADDAADLGGFRPIPSD